MCTNPMKPTAHTLLDIREETRAEWTFRVTCDSPPAFGQFYEVSLPRVGEMPISVSGVGDGWVDLTIRNVGKVTSAVHALKIGGRLFLRGPYGTGFPMDEFKGQHVVIVAGGSGVSPVRPVIEHFFKHDDEIEKLDLLFGFKEPSAVLFREDIERWQTKFNTVLTVDQASDEWEGKYVGLVTEYAKTVKLSDYPKMEIVIVGPPIMMRFTAEEFLKRSVPPERIIVSMERQMSCGIGKCGHCKVGECYVCQDGPVFRYDKAATLID